MRILVTGAASPLGRAVVAQLVRQGHRVVGLARRIEGVRALEKLGADAIRGDVRRPTQVADAMVDCEMVLHLAGFFDFWEPVSGTYESVNIDATRNVVAAALRARVRRLVVCSSSITMSGSDGARGPDDLPPTALERSKTEAERIALRARARGLEVVIVNPGLVIAPGDQGWVGRLVSKVVAGRRPLAAHATLGWVWVEDAARGVVRAGEVGEDGQRYVLAGEMVSSQKMLSALATCAGVRGPRALSPKLTLAEAALHTALARPLRRRPGLAIDEARFLLAGCRADGRRAREELGLEYTPAASYLPLVARRAASALRQPARPGA